MTTNVTYRGKGRLEGFHATLTRANLDSDYRLTITFPGTHQPVIALYTPHQRANGITVDRRDVWDIISPERGA